MAVLTKKIDFIGFITVERSNPNGDPLNGNQPRTDYGSYGEISDVCLKRKLRNRLQDIGEKILVQSNERADDGCDSIRSRVEANPAMDKPLKMKDKEQGRTRIFAEEACKAWIDVRSFGQVFALKEAKKQRRCCLCRCEGARDTSYGSQSRSCHHHGYTDHEERQQ